MLLESEDQARTVRTGELALVPHGGGHVLRSQQGAAAPDILDLDLERVSDRYEVLRHGEGGAPTTLVCGAVRFAHPAARKLVEALPPIIHVESPSPAEGQWIQASISLMATEARDMRPGGEAIITRAADILVVQAIRSWIETDPAAQSGWLGALRDPQIGPAISLIHSDPARPWTLDALARERAMSRSAFAARFTEVVGEPAMQYVTRWRMNLAVDSLSTRDATVAELADQLGYRSEAAFSRAFKRVIGISPGAVRRSGPTEAAGTVGHAGLQRRPGAPLKRRPPSRLGRHPCHLARLIPREEDPDADALAVPDRPDVADLLLDRVRASLDVAPLKDQGYDVIARVHELDRNQVVVVEALGPHRGDLPDPLVALIEVLLEPLRRPDPLDLGIEVLERRLDAILVERGERATNDLDVLLRHPGAVFHQLSAPAAVHPAARLKA